MKLQASEKKEVLSKEIQQAFENNGGLAIYHHRYVAG